MKCPNCGKEIANDSKFCEFCGTMLTEVSEMSQATVTFKEAITICFNKYTTFSGRASRAEYWWFFLFNFLVSFFAVLLDAGMGTTWLNLIVTLVFFLPGLSVAVRRCHDTNHSGWWLLCPIYNIILMFLEGDKGENEYGAA